MCIHTSVFSWAVSSIRFTSDLSCAQWSDGKQRSLYHLDKRPKAQVYNIWSSSEFDITNVLTWYMCTTISSVASSKCPTNAVCQSIVWTRILIWRFLSFYLLATYCILCSYLCTSLSLNIYDNLVITIIVYNDDNTYL